VPSQLIVNQLVLPLGLVGRSLGLLGKLLGLVDKPPQGRGQLIYSCRWAGTAGIAAASCCSRVDTALKSYPLNERSVQRMAEGWVGNIGRTMAECCNRSCWRRLANPAPAWQAYLDRIVHRQNIEDSYAHLGIPIGIMDLRRNRWERAFQFSFIKLQINKHKRTQLRRSSSSQHGPPHPISLLGPPQRAEELGYAPVAEQLPAMLRAIGSTPIF
jgi:hypothetical protein